MCYRLPHRRSAPESCWQSTARHPPRPPNSCFPARRARGIRSKLGATNSIEQYHLVLSRPRCCKPIELRPRSHHWPRVDSRGWLLSQGHDDDMSTQPCSYRWVRSAGGGGAPAWPSRPSTRKGRTPKERPSSAPPAPCTVHSGVLRSGMPPARHSVQAPWIVSRGDDSASEGWRNPALARACQRLGSYRRLHAWPPHLAMGPISITPRYVPCYLHLLEV